MAPGGDGGGWGMGRRCRTHIKPEDRGGGGVGRRRRRRRRRVSPKGLHLARESTTVLDTAITPNSTCACVVRGSQTRKHRDLLQRPATACGGAASNGNPQKGVGRYAYIIACSSHQVTEVSFTGPIPLRRGCGHYHDSSPAVRHKIRRRTSAASAGRVVLIAFNSTPKLGP